MVENGAHAGGVGGSTPWLWFFAWWAVGAGYMLGLLGIATVGLFVLPFAVVATVALALHRPARIGLPGLISGLSMPLFYVGFLNRDGPGTICVTSSTETSCVDEWSPWLFVVVGLALLAAGIVVMAVKARAASRRTRRSGDHRRRTSRSR